MAQLDTRIPMQVPNVLAQQAQVTQNNRLAAQSLGEGFNAVQRGMAAPLLREGQALQNQAGNMENMAREQHLLGGVLQGLAEINGDTPGITPQAQSAWAKARGYLVQNGVFNDGELPEALDMETFQGLSAIATMPTEKLTDMQRYSEWMQSGTPDQQRAAKVYFGLEEKAGSGNGFSLSVDKDGNLNFSQGGAGQQVLPDPEKRSEEFGKGLGKLDAKMVEEKRKIENGMGGLQRRDALLKDSIDEAIAQAQASVLNTGFIGQQSENIGGTPAFKLAQVLKTIKANLGFAELQSMRDNSPTGGALGQVTERELAFLQSIQGSLEIGQGDEQLIANLTRIKENIDAAAKDRQAAFEKDFGGAQQTPQVDLSTVSDDELMRALEAAQ